MLHSGGYTDKTASSEGLCSLTAKCLNNLISSRVGQVTYTIYLFIYLLRSKFWCLKSAYTPCWVPRPFSRSSPDQMWLSQLLSFIWKDEHLWAPWLWCGEDCFYLLLTAQLFTLFSGVVAIRNGELRTQRSQVKSTGNISSPTSFCFWSQGSCYAFCHRATCNNQLQLATP